MWVVSSAILWGSSGFGSVLDSGDALGQFVNEGLQRFHLPLKSLDAAFRGDAH
jgi:hypothetical protein